MSYELIGMTMFGGMLLMMLTGQRIFAAIGFVSATAALFLWGTGGVEMPFSAAFKLFNWYPLLTLPLFIYMGYILSESGIADDLYHMFHVWFGGVRGGLAIGYWNNCTHDSHFSHEWIKCSRYGNRRYDCAAGNAAEGL